MAKRTSKSGERSGRKRTPAARRSTRGTRAVKGWRLGELPAELQDELRDRVEEAKRGRSVPFDEAVAEAERMADEIVSILNRAGARRPAG
jgi:hypothetical protein